jgi:uncharacterized membrane protein
MARRLRKLVLTCHVVSSVGWLGALLAYLALDVTAVLSDDRQLVRGAYLAMELIALYVIVPLALASLLVGLINSLATPWGLIRHYWVLVKLLLTILAITALLVEIRTIRYLAAMAAAESDPRALPGTLLHSVGGLVVLLLITALSVYKPRGVTPYGWRRQQIHRARIVRR